MNMKWDITCTSDTVGYEINNTNMVTGPIAQVSRQAYVVPKQDKAGGTEVIINIFQAESVHGPFRWKVTARKPPEVHGFGHIQHIESHYPPNCHIDNVPKFFICVWVKRN